MSEQAPPVGGVLCAGFGTRMSPITDAIPKPLIPFLNTPTLAYALDHLSRGGVSRVAMNLHHLADSIPPVADQLAAAMNLNPSYSREWDILGTAGGIRGIWKALGEPDQTLIIMNGDSVMNIDLRQMLEAHRRSGASASLMVRRREEGQPGKVFIDPEGQRLWGMLDSRHPETPEELEEVLFAGVHFLEPELLETIPEEEGCIVRDIYMPFLEEGGHINVEVHSDFWAALDNPALLFKTTHRVLESPEIFEQVPMPEPLSEGLYVFNERGIDDATQFAGPVLTGPHTAAGAQAKIGPNAVVDGVEISEGASVRNAIVYGMGNLEGKWQRCVAIAGKVANLPELECMQGAVPMESIDIEDEDTPEQPDESMEADESDADGVAW